MSSLYGEGYSYLYGLITLHKYVVWVSRVVPFSPRSCPEGWAFSSGAVLPANGPARDGAEDCKVRESLQLQMFLGRWIYIA